MKKNLKIFIILGALAGIAMHIINRIIYYAATVDNLLDDMEENYYEWRFGKIFYKKAGSGPPILLVHDLTSASSSFEWNQTISDLAKTNTVYAIDLLGCGRSDKPNITYTSYLYVQLVNDFIKHNIGDKADVIATGASCSFILMACNNGEHLVNRIALVNPEDLIELAKIPTKRTRILKFIIQIPVIGTLLYNMLNRKSDIDGLFRSHYYYNAANVDQSIIDTYHEAAHIGNTQSKYLFASIKGRYTNANILHCLENMNHSIFIIAGKGNPLNLQIGEQYTKYVPSIEVFPIEKTKHLPQLESPDAFIEQVQILFTAEE